MNDNNGRNPDASQRSVLVLNLGGMLIAFVTLGLTWFIISLFGVNLSKVSFFVSSRTLLLVVFLVLALPLGIFGEYWLSRWKKRLFLWRNTLLIIGVFGLFISVTAFFLTIFDLLLSEMLWLWQMPLVAVSNLIGLSVMAIAIRNKKFRKWRRELGW